MGTNYYLQEIVDCDLGHEHIRKTHIGKASTGWKFCFHSTELYSTFKDWDRELAGGNDNYHLIHNEYGEIVKWKALLKLIDVKQDGKTILDSSLNYVDTDYMDGEYWFCKNDFS